MDTLTEYLGKSGITQRQLAVAARVSPSYMNEIVQKLKTPSLAVALRIHRATGGEVEIEALVKSPLLPVKRGDTSERVQGQVPDKTQVAS